MHLIHCAVLLLSAVLMGCQAIVGDEFNHLGPDGTDSTPTDSTSDTNSDAVGNTDADTNSDAVGNTDVDTNSDAVGDTVSDTNSDAVGDTAPDTGTSFGRDSDTNADSGSASDTGTDSDGNADTDIISDTQTDTNSAVDTNFDTHTETSADTDTGAATDADSDTKTDTDAEPDTDTQCAGQPNFTACELVTSSDRHYDICIYGRCRSPGCGTYECNPPGPNFTVPDSNQRVCYDEDDAISCPSLGDFFGQDAQYGWDLTHPSDDRFTRQLPDSTIHPVTIDNVTGLIWQGCSAGQIGDDCLLEAGAETDVNADETAVRRSWDDAVVYCDELDWGGWQDWHLPSYYELLSIIDSGTFFPAVDDAAFPNTMASEYWTVSNDFKYSGMAWEVNFFYGRTNQRDKGIRFFVRCVRGGAPAAVARYTRMLPPQYTANPVVTDNVVGLMWQGCLNNYSGANCEGEMQSLKWVDAMDYCEQSKWAGYADWRLPGRNELISLLSDRTVESTADLDAFPFDGYSAYSVWSATSQSQSNNQGWLLRFGGTSGGEFDDPDKSNAYGVAHCVRDFAPGK